MSKPSAPQGRAPGPRARRKRRTRNAPAGSAPDTARPGRNAAESPIAWLFSRRDGNGNPLISEAQFHAGERLRADFWFAQMTPNVTQNWSLGVPGGGKRGAPGAGVDLSDRVIEAGNRVRRALAAVGPELADILIDVCCHLKGLEEAERKAKWPQRSGKIVLGVALSALARHYGFAGAPSAAPRVTRIRHWGAEDFRPSIDAEEEEGDGTV